jgi:gamma-glutamyl phosphate reductase
LLRAHRPAGVQAVGGAEQLTTYKYVVRGTGQTRP